jgi:hypothetical protein
MRKTAFVLAAWLVVSGCGTLGTVRVPRRGESALTLSCGGPVARYLKVNAPVPYAVLRYDYGLTDRFGLNVAEHLLPLVYRQIGMQADLTCRLTDQRGWIPAVGVTGGLLLFSAPHSDSRVYPEFAASASYRLGDRLMTYFGVQGLLQLSPNRDPQTPPCVWAPVLGGDVRLNKRLSMALETKWYAPFAKTSPRTIEYLLPIGGRGAVGFVLGVNYAFGSRGSS